MWNWILSLLLMAVAATSVSGSIKSYYLDLRCGTMLKFPGNGLEAIRLRLTNKNTYKKNADCVMYLETYSREQLMIYFKSINIESSSTCNRDWLEVRDGPTLSSPYVGGINGRLCGYYTDGYVHTTRNNSLTVRFVSDEFFNSGGFDMIITTFHRGSCSGGEHTCDNGRCISKSVTCNGYNPCGDYSDCPLSTGAIAGIVVGCTIFVIVTTVLLLIIRRRRRLRRGATETHVQVTTSGTYGAADVGYNQPVPQQYPSYPTGQAPPPQQYPQQYPQQQYPQ